MPRILKPEEKAEKLEQLSANIRGFQIGESIRDSEIERVIGI
jgi:hypothetical protein